MSDHNRPARLSIAKTAGFCFGVSRAIAMTEAAAREGAYAIGTVIHNTSVVESLEAAGLHTVGSAEEVPAGTTAVIRAHGECQAVYAALAEKQNIPERFLLKIMRSLTKAGIMKSYRGVEGGFALQRAPKDITLFDVIDAVEGQTELQRCLHDIGSCSRGCSGMCSIYAAFADIQRDLAARLKSIDFETLAKQEANLRMVHEAEAQLTAKKEAAEK